MNFPRIISAFAATIALSACGGQYDIDTPVQLASVTTGASAAQASAIAQPTAAAMPATASVASSTMPAPDCAPEGCASLRIIDGNAEAWRIDAQRRAALEAGPSQS